jgi:hypothetical protein
MKEQITTVSVSTVYAHGRPGYALHGRFGLWFNDRKTTYEFPRFTLFVDGILDGSDEGTMDTLVEARLTREELVKLRDALNLLLEHQDPT